MSRKKATIDAVLPESTTPGRAQRAVFGTTDPLAVHESIVDGTMPFRKTLDALSTVSGVSARGLAPVLGMSTRTIERRLKGTGSLVGAEADRAYRFARMVDLAIELIGSERNALDWLVTANRSLGARTPLAMLETEIGTRAVERVLYAIAYGGVA